MLKIHDDIISATNELIKQTHVHYENQIQHLEKEIKQKNGFHMIMHQVLIKSIRSVQHFMDTPNQKFEDMILIL